MNKRGTELVDICLETQSLEYPSLVLPLQDFHRIGVNLEYIMLSIFQTDLLRFVVYIFPLSNNVNMFWIIEKSLKQLTKISLFWPFNNNISISGLVVKMRRTLLGKSFSEPFACSFNGGWVGIRRVLLQIAGSSFWYSCFSCTSLLKVTASVEVTHSGSFFQILNLYHLAIIGCATHISVISRTYCRHI